jgi:hypothetical protein
MFTYALCEAGSTGAAPLAIGGGSIGDLFSERDRALAMAVYVIGPLIGMVHYSEDMNSFINVSLQVLLLAPLQVVLLPNLLV